MNNIFLLGRLTRDPEIRITQSGKMTTSFTLAVKRNVNDESDFINIVTWDKLAENCGISLYKGSRALVSGRLQIRNFDGKDGQKKWVTEVIAQNVQFFDRKQADSSQINTDFNSDDEIPF